MVFDSFKTMINLGMNISNDFEFPVTKTLEKNKVNERTSLELSDFALIHFSLYFPKEILQLFF